MANWHYQFPTVTLSKKVIGDKLYAERFHGDGMLLLAELKNLMTFRKLGQLMMLRKFTDGTQILVKSIFGYDFITIDVSRSVFVTGAIEQSCTITFTFLNGYVQPMRYPKEVREGEQEGIDYIKTYYRVEKSNCPSCANDVEWEFTFNYQTEEQIDYYDSEPNNHCVISQDGGCYGEVIETGEDADGTYVIWKTYTEGMNQNRSGLGYMRFHAVLRNRDTKAIVCEFTEIIGVDCCIKDGLEKPDIYWETWQWVECAGGTYNGTCAVPDIISRWKLNWYAAGEGGNAGRFYAFPEIGGCPPYEWSLDGPGSIEVTDPWGRAIIYHPKASDEPECDDVKITVRDRCGNEDFFRAAVCDFAAPLSLGYTSLQMSCGGAQSLSPIGGVAPFIWSLQGGGTLVVNDDLGLSATYTAPAANADCALNPTIMVSDCCGTSADIKIAVNCVAGGAEAYRLYEADCIPAFGGGCTGCGNTGCPPPDTWTQGYADHFDTYKCDGTWIAQVAGVFGIGYAYGGSCTHGQPYPGDACNRVPGCFFFGAPGCPPNATCTPYHCGEALDKRTPAQKAAGCCPINPYTGLPF